VESLWDILLLFQKISADRTPVFNYLEGLGIDNAHKRGGQENGCPQGALSGGSLWPLWS
jgi:hypothetical protein